MLGTSGLAFSNQLKRILLTSSDLGEEIQNVDDIQNKMIKDAKFFEKIQKQIVEMTNLQFEGLRAQAQQEYKGAENKEKLEQALSRIADMERVVTNDLTEQFVLMQKQATERKNSLVSLRNAKEVIDELGAQIRDPQIFANKFLKDVGQWPLKLLEAAKAGKGFKNIIDVIKVRSRKATNAF